MGEESACNAGDTGRRKFDPQVGKIPWRRAWQPTPVSLPGESPGQRSLVGSSPEGHRESDTTERTFSMGETENLCCYIIWPSSYCQ